MAAALGQADWARHAASLAPGAAPVADAGPPSYGELVLTGLAVVEELTAADRWADARLQAAHLADYFTAVRRRLDAVAAVAFQGLCDAVQGHDRDDMADHADLLRELFGGADAAAS